MLNIPELFKTHSITPRGVIHIGAHLGEEIPLYLELGFTSILLIEANPYLFDTLAASRTYAGSGIRIFNIAITNYNGFATLHCLSDSACSSLHRPKLHSTLYPHITKIGELTVPCRTLDTLMVEQALPFTSYNYLHLDIQGGEANAILGATETLRHIEALTSEVNLREIYSGAMLKDPFDLLLSTTHNLHPRAFKEGGLTAFDGWGDCFYTKGK